MKCHQCGYDLPATAKFCRSCGAVQNQISVSDIQVPAAPKQNATLPAKDSAIQPKVPPVAPQEPTAPIKASTAVPQAMPFAPTISIPTSQPASSAPKSKTAIYAVIAILVATIVGGVGYWVWTQKKAADEQAAILATQQAEEQKRKTDEEQLQKIKEAEEKGRKEAEEKAKQDAQQAAASAAQPQSTPQQQQQQTQVTSVLEKATKCEDFKNCFSTMLEAAAPRTAEAIAVAATRISELNKFQRGDRKAARDLNKKGLEEFKNKNFPLAIDLLTKAVAADPADVEIRSNLGFVLMQANRVDDAGTALANALILEPRRTSTWVPIAEVFSVKGNSDAAVRALLLGYEFSANKEKSIAFYEVKSNTAERAEMKPIFASAAQKIKAGQMN